jgi:transposase
LKKIDLPKESRKLLNEELDLLEYLREKIKTSDSVVAYLASKDERARRLMTLPGIGRFFALLIAVEIDDIKRFRKKEKLASYAGLIPSVHSSADKTYYGKIVSHGNKYLGWAFIEAVWPAIRKDLRLKELYDKVKQRKKVNIAKVAVARRLCEIAYRVLLEDRDYVANYTPVDLISS